MNGHGLRDLDRLLSLAEDLAASLGAQAGAAGTIGRERAVLRLLGVHGLDRDGRPLAGEVVKRYVAGSPSRLAAGIALPFAMAVVVYESPPHEIALDAASGAIDLALEAEALHEPDRRVLAEASARRLMAAALERVDANRTATHELQRLLGDAGLPWVGTSLVSASTPDAAPEMRRLVAGGVDLVRVAVPAGRELTDRLYDVGVAVPSWHPQSRRASDAQRPEPAPSGSQRGLAQLRDVADAAAAERGGYVRLLSASPPLAAPEQAVVAAFERVDVVEVDPMGEIVSGHVDPERALADHAFANRLHVRAGTLVLLGPGPLVVAPDLRRGMPSDPATRAGRAFALQAVAAILARNGGLRDDALLLGAVPPWLADESEPASHAIAQVHLRRAGFPGLRLAFEEPGSRPTGWPFVLAAVLEAAGPAPLVIRAARPDGDVGRVAVETRAAAAIAAEVARSRAETGLRGPALDHALAALASGVATLERLSAEGWDAILGEPLGGAGRPRLGADAVAARTERFDPLGEDAAGA